MSTITGTWYFPALGTGGFLHECQLFTNPTFTMTTQRAKLLLDEFNAGHLGHMHGLAKVLVFLADHDYLLSRPVLLLLAKELTASLLAPYGKEASENMSNTNTEPLWRRIGGSVGPYDLGPTEIAAILKLIADEVERRGDLGHDLDPGETADWLRAEGVQALLDAQR